MATYLKYTQVKTELVKTGVPNILGTMSVALIFIMIFMNYIVTSYLWFKSFKKNKKQNTIKVAPFSEEKSERKETVSKMVII